MDKVCGRPGCTNRLRADNLKGVCSKLHKCGGIKNGSPPPAPKPKPAPVERGRSVAEEIDATSKDTLRRFRMLAEAVGFKPDDVLAEFAQSWLDRALSAVNPPKSEGLES